MKHIFSFLTLLGALLVFGGCASTGDIKPADVSLVKAYTVELEKDKPMDSPYLAKFERADKRLLFVASQHVSLEGYSSYLDHPTLRTIRRAFDEYRPGVVVVEGINTGDTLSPRSILSKVNECVSSGFRSDCGESMFAIAEARDRNTEWISGEPDDIEIKNELAGKGYGDWDLLGFYMVRQVPQWKRRTGPNVTLTDRVVLEQLERFQQRLKIHSPDPLTDLKKWYVRKIGPWKSFWGTTSDDTAPHGGEQATYIQKISHQVSLIRDRIIVRRIEKMVRQYPTVLAIFGASHLLTQKDALASMIGEPRYFSLKHWSPPETASRPTKDNPGLRR